MKLFINDWVIWLLIFTSLVLLSGCHWNACQYCHENREPDIESNEQIDIGDGLYKCVNTKRWIHIEHKATRIDYERWNNK